MILKEITPEMVRAVNLGVRDDVLDEVLPLPSSWRPIDLLTVGDGPSVLPTIGGLFYPGHRHVVMGEPESVKSWISLCIAADEVKRGEHVFCFDFESSPRDILGRLRDLRLTDGELERFHYIQPSEPLSGDLAGLARESKPSLCIVDAMIGALSLHGLDPNQAVDVESLHRHLIDPLASSGAAVVIIDHVAKDKERRGRFATGSERKIGRVDVALSVTMVSPFGRGRTARAVVTTMKDRPGCLLRPKAAEVELRSDPGSGKVTWSISFGGSESEGGSFRPTVLMQRVSEFLQAQSEAVTQSHVEASVYGQAKALRLATATLVDEGYVAQENGARGAKLLSSKRPYPGGDA